MEKETLEDTFRQGLIGKRILEIKLYSINGLSFNIKDCDRQILDAGIEFSLDEGVFSFGWNSAHEVLNATLAPMSEMCTEEDIQTFSTANDHYWRQQKGKKIAAVDFHFNWIQYPDQPKIFIPDMVKIRLENNFEMLMAAMQYEIAGEGCHDFALNSEEDIVVFFDPEEVAEMWDEHSKK
jgi:hypothetical protein